MADPFGSDSFKNLRAEWNQRLKDSGFEDIEDEKGRFIDHHSIEDLNELNHFKPGIKEVTESYYDWACDMLYRGSFKSTRDRKIWELHCNGSSVRRISNKVGLEYTWISRKIHRITRELKSQEYPSSVLPYIKTSLYFGLK